MTAKQIIILLRGIVAFIEMIREPLLEAEHYCLRDKGRKFPDLTDKESRLILSLSNTIAKWMHENWATPATIGNCVEIEVQSKKQRIEALNTPQLPGAQG